MVTPPRRDGYLSRPGVDVTAVPFHPVLATAYRSSSSSSRRTSPTRSPSDRCGEPLPISVVGGAVVAWLDAINGFFDAGLAILRDTTYLSPDYPRAYDFVPVERDEEGQPIMSGLEAPEP